jgi:hypothetical protein
MDEEATDDELPSGGVTTSQLEQRIRLLPAVRSCSIDDNRVTVLVDSSTDRRMVAADIAYILTDVGMERMVHVLGGTTRAVEVLSLETRARDARRALLLLVAGVVAIVCIALGVVMLISDDNGVPAAPVRTQPTSQQVTTTNATPTTTATFPENWELRPRP